MGLTRNTTPSQGIDCEPGHRTCVFTHNSQPSLDVWLHPHLIDLAVWRGREPRGVLITGGWKFSPPNIATCRNYCSHPSLSQKRAISSSQMCAQQGRGARPARNARCAWVERRHVLPPRGVGSWAVERSSVVTRNNPQDLLLICPSMCHRVCDLNCL